MKSSEATYSIGEFAGRFGLPAHVLRFWESSGLLQPAKRVAGRRRYTQEDVVRVILILRGKQAGFSLAQLGEMLNAPNASARRELLRRQRAELDKWIKQATESKRLIDHALKCGHADFTRCTSFRRLARSISAEMVTDEVVPIDLDRTRRHSSLPECEKRG
nr:MerR family transcriptional regulator [Amycolatopsis sp. YIM 10]